MMKVRSCALVLCMVAVPGLALFSHLTPPAACAWVRQMLGGFRREAVATDAAPLPVSIERSAVVAAPARVAVAIEPVFDHGDPPPQGGVSRPSAESPAVHQLRSRLTMLGATAVDCRPQPGDVSGYASSCRVGIDPSGQLHRMFHGHGVDASAALQSLVEQVQAWQGRQAGHVRQRL